MEVICCICLVVASLIGAYIPFIKKLDDEKIHLLIALSAGIFLGILFFLLLPEAMEESVEDNIEPHYIMMVVLIGFLLILLIDVIIKHFHGVSCACECHNEEHSHNMASLSAFIGLAVHAFVDGLLIATAGMFENQEIVFLTLFGFCVHKFIELFSLSSTFLLTNLEKKDIMKYLLVFTCITPLGMLISGLFFNNAVDIATSIPFAFSAGTFMYVSFCQMIPEAFHRKKNTVASFVLLMVGIAVAAVVFLVFGHQH